MWSDVLDFEEVIDKLSTIIIRKPVYYINMKRKKSNNKKNKGNGTILSDKFNENNASWNMATQIPYFPLARIIQNKKRNLN